MTQDHAVSLLRTALAADLDHLAVPAFAVAVETNAVLGELLSQVLRSQPVSRETLMRIAAASPYPSLALAAPAAFVLQRLAGDSADDSERAGWLVDLSNRLGELGQREEALAAIEEAVTIYRQLAARPARRVPARPRRVAEQPVELPGRPGAAGGGPGRDRGSRSIHRQLAAARPDVFLPDLAMSLKNQSGRLADLGRREEALAAIEQAADIYRQLAEAAPDAFLPGPRRGR